jgi:predicted dehydrogenase
VFIATNDDTHVSLALEWLEESNCRLICIEKPLCNDLDEAMQLAGKGVGKDRRIRCYDHYRARVHANLNYRDFFNRLEDHLRSVRVFRFYFLENHSGTDTPYLQYLASLGLEDRNGPIENEQRQDAVRHGLVLDMLPHLPALLDYLGDPNFELQWVQAARYCGLDYKDDKSTEIDHETFAAIGFAFATKHYNQETFGEAYIGKGLRGVKAYPLMDNNVKLIELEGTNGNRIHLDLRGRGETASSAYLLRKGRKRPETLFELEQDPYYYLFKKIFQNRTDDVLDLTLPLRTGKRILDSIGDVRRVLGYQARNRKTLDTYLLGNKAGRQPPYLEELCEILPIIWGKRQVHAGRRRTS